MKKLAAEFFGAVWLVLGGWALSQWWLFSVAPVAGAMGGGLVHRTLPARD